MSNNKTIKKIKEKVDLDGKQKNYLKNYVILGVLFLVCIALTLYFCKSYEVYQEYEKEIPVIRDSLVEINPEDLEHYIADTSSTVIYMCTAMDQKCRSFEKDFKKYIHKNEITDEIVYLNLTNVDQKTFTQEFNDKYPNKIKYNGKLPAFVSFQDGKIVSILQESQQKKITMSKVQNFLELYLLKEEEEYSVSDSEDLEFQ